MVPDSTVHYGTDGLIFARAYYRLGEQEKAEALVAAIKGRIDGNLDWYSRLKPLQISNTLSDIVYNNINPMLLVNNIYQQYDQEKYQLMTEDLLQRAQFFYMQGVSYVGDLILKEITDGSVRNYYATPQEDTLSRATAEETMQKALKLMQQFSPRLLEQYKTTPQ